MVNSISAINAGKPRVLVLTPVYNEEEALPIFEREIKNVLFSVPDYDIRVLFIEDGSTDLSWEVIRRICGDDCRFQGLRLSRNFGSHIALAAGFDHAQADILCTLACDLQDPPEVILQFLKGWEAGYKIVWGKRKTRSDDRWRILFSNLFSGLIRNFAMPKGSKFTTGSFFLIDKIVVECFRQFQESNRITFALVAWTGFDQTVVEYDRKMRVAGKSGWSFPKMINTMYDAFIGFSPIPVRLITLIGLGVSLLALLLVPYTVICWQLGNPLRGWTSIMTSLTFFFGLQFLLLGIMGEYLYRIYAESVRRPLYFISEKVASDDD